MNPMQQEQQIFEYLAEDQPINPLKLELSTSKVNNGDESCKENDFKNVRIATESGSTIKFLVDRDTNSHFSQSYATSILSAASPKDCSSTASTMHNNNQILAKSNSKSNQPSRDIQLQEWRSAKKERSPSERLTKANNNNMHSTSASKMHYLSGASSEKNHHNHASDSTYMTQGEIMQKYFTSRVGYGDGKSTTGLPAGMKNTPTKPQSPKFHTTQRSQIHSMRNKLFEEMEEKRNSSLKKKKIDPANFRLETDLRARSRHVTPVKSEQEIEKECIALASSFKARAVPEYKEFVLQKSEKKQIVFNEFSLSTEDRGRQKESQLKSKLQEESEAEQKARLFHATQIPDYNELATQFVGCQMGNQPRPTLPIGFKFETDKRAAEHLIGREPVITAYGNHEQENNNNLFKAKRMPDFSKTKSPIRPSPRKTTVPHEPILNSTLRAHERKLFDEVVKEKTLAEKEAEEKAEAERAEREKKEFEEIMHQNAFKASSVKKFKPVELHKSEVPLTQPESPKFQTSIRATINQLHQQF